MEEIAETTRRERKKEETRLKIIDIAMQMFRTRGFDTTTMDQIAAEADVAKGTLYNYFPQKEAIISQYWQDSLKAVRTQLSTMVQSLPDTKSRLNALFRKAAGWLKAQDAITSVYIRYRMQNIGDCEKNKSLRSGFEGILISLISAGQEAGDIRKDVDVRQLTGYLEMMYLLVCLRWIADPKAFPLEKNLTQMVDFFMRGSGTTGDRNKPGQRSPEKG